ALVEFAHAPGKPVIVSTKKPALIRVTLPPGQSMRLSDGTRVEVLGEAGESKGLKDYETTAGTRNERELFGLAPTSDLVSAFREGRFGHGRDYALPLAALRLDDERRCDALGAMLASRVRVQPHQIGVVQRVLSAQKPRFILADEVGLGKTIEAGMIYLG